MNSDERPISRCVCFDVTFEKMLAEGCVSVEDAATRWGCGTNCGLCIPYIKHTLKTGEVRHAVFAHDEL